MPVADLGHVPESFASAGWDQLLHKLLNERAKNHAWQFDERARQAFAAYGNAWKRQARGIEPATVSGALVTADVHPARVELVLAEAELPGAGSATGSASAEIVHRAAAIVAFTLDRSRALPANGPLAVSRRDETLDHGVSRLLGWLEEHGGIASKRDVQRSEVAGVTSATEVDALLARYVATYPETSTVERSSHGGRPTTTVRAPRRQSANSNVGPSHIGASSDESAHGHRGFDGVARHRSTRHCPTRHRIRPMWLRSPTTSDNPGHYRRFGIHTPASARTAPIRTSRGEVCLSQSHRSGSELVHIGGAPAFGFGLLDSMVCDWRSTISGSPRL